MSGVRPHSDMQLTLEQLVTVDRSVHEIRLAAERALAGGRLRYGGELTELAEKLSALQLLLGPKAIRPRVYCATCGCSGRHWRGCPART